MAPTSTLIRAGAALLAVGLAGCSRMPPWYSRAWSPRDTPGAPLVRNCGIVSIGSPTRYVCNGKVYTSFQLTKLRQEWNRTQPATR
ncbi:MAG: hypothetical protein ACREQX_02770 [Candidatus Binataceae bacterium]